MSEAPLRSQRDLTTTLDVSPGVRIHALHTGTVRVAPRAVSDPPAGGKSAPRSAAPTWTRPFPIFAFAIEHAAGATLIDTGPSPAMNDAHNDDGEFAGRLTLKWDITYDTTADLAVGAQLRRVGLPSASINRVVLTHLHGDHCGAMHEFQHARILVGRAEYESAAAGSYGASPSHWPAWFKPDLVDYDYSAIGPFGRSYGLDQGRITLVPTDGHSAGHQSVVFREGGLAFIFGGDVAFSQRHLIDQEIVGLCRSVPRAKASMADVLTLARGMPTVFLAAHDVDTPRRLREREVVPG